MVITVPARRISVPVPSRIAAVPPITVNTSDIQILVTPPDVVVHSDNIEYTVESYEIDVPNIMPIITKENT